MSALRRSAVRPVWRLARPTEMQCQPKTNIDGVGIPWHGSVDQREKQIFFKSTEYEFASGKFLQSAGDGRRNNR